ncbi:hypothetical protein Tco_0051579 [Tanacetum coccineum]
MIDADEQLAARLQAEEQKQFSIEEKSRMLVEMIAKRKKFFAAQREAKQRSKPPTKNQIRNRMCTYLKNMGGYKHNQLKGRKESSKRVGNKLESEKSKKKKIDEHVEAEKVDDQEEAEMKKHIEIVKDDEKLNIKFRGGLLGLKDFKMILRVTTAQLQLLSDYYCWRDYVNIDEIKD